MTALPRIGFLGAGQMATALAQGIIRAKIAAPDGILAADVFPAARERFRELTGGRVTGKNEEVCEFAPLVVVAVKPQQIESALAPLNGLWNDHLLVSIAAGITTETLAELTGAGTRIVRVMPNTPALVGAGAAAIAMGPGAAPADAETVRRIFDAVGLTIEVPERLLDVVTGLSGSGPAYVYLMIEALADGAVAEGMTRDAAQRLAAQTVMGAARMVLETGQHPGALKDAVTSPAGTTAEGLAVLERAAARSAFLEAVRAGSRRSRELRRSSGP